MKRWSVKASAQVERPDVDAFIEEVLAVCARHGFSLSHEDGHGAFEVVAHDEDYADWLRNAHDATDGVTVPAQQVHPTKDTDDE
jgi:hypothetical protein